MGKEFVPDDQRNQWALQHPDLLTKVQPVPAVRKDGIIVPQPSVAQASKN